MTLWVHQFPIASVTDCRRLNGLEQHKCLLFENILFWREIRSPERVDRAELSLEALRENLFPRLFQLLEAACVPWHVTLHHCDLCLRHHITSDFDLPASLL